MSDSDPTIRDLLGICLRKLDRHDTELDTARTEIRTLRDDVAEHRTSAAVQAAQLDSVLKKLDGLAEALDGVEDWQGAATSDLARLMRRQEREDTRAEDARRQLRGQVLALLAAALTGGAALMWAALQMLAG